MADEWVEVFVTYDEIEAQIVKDVFESEGITTVTRSMKVSPYPVNVGRMGEVRLIVRTDDVEKAKDILKIMNDASGKELNDY